MKPILIFTLVLLFESGLALADMPMKSLVPLNVDTVTTSHLHGGLVRTILYQTKQGKRLDIELIRNQKTRKLIAKSTIDEIKLVSDNGQRILPFSSSADVFIDNVKLDGSAVKFYVQYYIKHRGGYYLSLCSVDVAKDRLQLPNCTLQDQGL